MSFQILDIVLYSHDGRHRVLSLRPGQVNIITGGSKTGKTALISIVDYCLGSSSCDVPEGPIRRCVAWIGLRLQLASQQAFVGRRVPAVGSSSSTDVFYEVGNEVQAPEGSDLRPTTNVDTLVGLLGAWAGIGPTLHEPPTGQTRRPLAATLRHALAFTFQPQYEINQPQHLFHRQSDNWIAQAIKDTLPYFLGAVDDDHVAKKAELRRLQQRLRECERRLATMESVRGQGLGKAAALLAEARDLRLLEPGESPGSWEDAVELLRRAATTTAEVQVEHIELGAAGEEFDRLMAERALTQDSLRRAKDELAAAKALMSDERGYSREVGEQKARLKSIGVLPDAHDRPVCPLCTSPLDRKVPSVAELEAAVEQASDQLDRVTRHSPQLQGVVDELAQRVQALTVRLSENREALEAVRVSNERLSAMREASARRAHVLGRVTLYLESLPEVADTSGLRQEIAGLRTQIVALVEELSDESIQERLDSFLAILGTKMIRWARDLELEHSEYSLRLDFRHLSVVADTDAGPLYMNRMGSGENWVGYHIIAHLALHDWFTRKQRPVPRFLFLDQPSQVYFPAERDVEGSTAILTEDDRIALNRMLKLVVDVVAELAPDFQVVITEHADIGENWYSRAVVERWRGGRKLVPADWPGAEGEEVPKE
jgi:hypothetical protein